jgi:glycosyltransferase involved in cell wall biosynthesis
MLGPTPVLDSPMSVRRRRSRPKLAVTVTFPVYPPRGGGQVRIFYLYRELARAYDVELVTLGLQGTAASRREIAPGLWEIRVPKSAEHGELEFLLQREAGTIVTDVAMSLLYRSSAAYLDALRDAARGARAVIASHPYTLPAIREVTDAPLWYEAHNVEVRLKEDVLVGTARAGELLREVERVERACCEEAELIWTCSQDDRTELIGSYGVPPGRVLVVPNGVAREDLNYVPIQTRREHKRRLGMGDRCLAVFIGSWHGPNVAAAQTLIDLAPSHPDVDFMCLGSVGMALVDAERPANMDVTGPFASEFKRAVLSVADLALNPVVTGSGTNLKMLDYFAAGTPVISTSFGARGLGIHPDEHYILGRSDEFGRAIEEARHAGESSLAALTAAASAHVTKRLTWPVIASELLASLSDR